jgi:oxygen-independent coproporphyrinogen-3 oxidase
MKIYFSGHNYKYAAEQILLSLFSGEKPEYPEGPPLGDRVYISLSEGEKYYTAFCSLKLSGKEHIGRASVAKHKITDELSKDRCLQKIIRLSFYRAAIASGLPRPTWGALTGIRPAKLMSNLLEEGMSEALAVSEFCREYDVSRDRALLCLYAARAGLACSDSLSPRDVCLYVGIPFCPTRCSYCSFVSQSVSKSMELIPPFLEALYSEIKATAAVIKMLNLRPISLYLGGGTPTTLSANQLHELCEKLYSAFDLGFLREFTVEAGRPDTINAEKLRVLKAHGVTRVSINPQTMDDRILEAIGRRHTAEDIFRALDEAALVGGLEINMDLIAGLPLDTPDTFKKTLNSVLDIGPENITIHTLSLKKGSSIMLEGTVKPTAEQVSEMLDYASASLFSAAYEPYYLYRQKYMSGGFENIGWQRGNRENIYNICIMEELCSIISMGGGASTKLCAGNGRLERIFNPKYPAEYISSIDKIIKSKEKIKETIW